MIRLIQFTTSAGDTIYINPAQVVMVQDIGDAVNVSFNGDSFAFVTVRGPIQTVLTELRGVV